MALPKSWKFARRCFPRRYLPRITSKAYFDRLLREIGVADLQSGRFEYDVFIRLRLATRHGGRTMLLYQGSVRTDLVRQEFHSLLCRTTGSVDWHVAFGVQGDRWFKLQSWQDEIGTIIS